MKALQLLDKPLILHRTSDLDGFESSVPGKVGGLSRLLVGASVLLGHGYIHFIATQNTGWSRGAARAPVHGFSAREDTSKPMCGRVRKAQYWRVHAGGSRVPLC